MAGLRLERHHMLMSDVPASAATLLAHAGASTILASATQPLVPKTLTTAVSNSLTRSEAVRARKPEAQKREVLIAAGVINKMTALGMPESVPVAA
jgi:hypothetical protein